MVRCEQIQGLLYRVAECDAAPEEAMRVARHLPDCTACRILLARERRLAALLEQDLEDLPEDEAFVRSVMDTLPAGPPPRAPATKSRRRSWRGLKLASVAGLLHGGLLVLSWGGFRMGVGSAEPALPSLDPQAAQGAGERLLHVVYLAAAAVRSAATRWPVDLPSSPVLAQFFLALAIAAVGTLLAGSTLLALAAHSAGLEPLQQLSQSSRGQSQTGRRRATIPVDLG